MSESTRMQTMASLSAVPAIHFHPPRVQPDHTLIATEAFSHLNLSSDFPQPILTLANAMPYHIATYINTKPNQASILDYLKTQLPTIQTSSPEYSDFDREDMLCAIILAPLKPNIEPLLIPTGSFQPLPYLKFKSQAISSWQRILSTQTPKFKQHESFFNLIYITVQKHVLSLETKPARTKRKYNRTKPVDCPILKKPRSSMVQPQQPQLPSDDDDWVIALNSPPMSPPPPPSVHPREAEVNDQDHVLDDLFQLHMSDEDYRFFDSIMQDACEGSMQYVNETDELDRRTDTVVSILLDMNRT